MDAQQERAVVQQEVDTQLDVWEDKTSVRGPGWYEAECMKHGWHTSGYESVVEDEAWEHARTHLVEHGVLPAEVFSRWDSKS